MFGMSLPTGQQRVLERIEGKLRESDPRLVSLFTIFTRLTLTEKMPWIEQVKVRPVAYRIARIGTWFRGIGRRPAARVRAMLLLPAALAATACALTIAFGFPGSQRPAPGARTPAPPSFPARPPPPAAHRRIPLIGGHALRAAASRAGTLSQPSCFHTIFPPAESSTNQGWSCTPYPSANRPV